MFLARAGLLANEGENIREKGECHGIKRRQRKSPAGSRPATVIAFPALPPGDMRLGGWLIYTPQDQVHSFTVFLA